MSEPNPSGCFNWSIFFDLIKTATGVGTALVAWSAYKIGKKYFNKGQENALSLSSYNKSLESLNTLLSNLVEHQRLCKVLLNKTTSVEQVDVLLQNIANNHEETDKASQKALFVGGIEDIRTRYHAWYDKWFVDIAESGLIGKLYESSKRDKVIDQIGSQVLSEVYSLIEALETIKTNLKPETSIQ